MDIRRILADLCAERDRLDQAISALEALGATGRKSARRGAAFGAAPVRKRKRRHMSAAARKRISEMMKKRWAERKKKIKAA